MLSLNLDDLKKAFSVCEFPFYKNIQINGNKAECTLYSIKSNYHTTIYLDLSDFDKLIHQISIELIKLRSQEIVENQTVIKQAEGISFKLD